MTKEYIRTDKGYIFEVDEEKKVISAINFLNVQYGNIIKHSKKLIEIINEEDYVNGHRVISVDIENDLIYCDTKGYETPIHSKDIKEILTKEAYLDNCYEIEQK